MPQSPDFPYQDGDVTVLGPETFAAKDDSVISWKGDNYIRQQTAGPALQYTTSIDNQGTQAVCRLDMDVPTDHRERAICRALLHHALALLDASEPARRASVGMEARRP